MAKTTVVQADLIARDRASPVVDKFGRTLRNAGKDTNLLSKATVGLVKAFGGYVAIRSATNFLKDANAEAREAQKVGKLTANVIKTTGGVANVTAKQVSGLANSISLKTGKDDEAIQSGANLLLTFKRVRNEVGSGSKVFDRATRAAVDLSASGFGSITTTSKQLGKALNDPVKGITALGRAGVTFSDSQKKQIKQLVEQNDLLGAQKIILGEVESQVKGSAAAQATAGDKATQAYANMKEVIGTALLPVVDDFSDALVKRGVPAARELAHWLKDEGVPGARDFYQAAKPIAEDVLPLIGDAAGIAVDALETIGPVVGVVTDAFGKLPDSAKNMVLLGGAATLLSGKFKRSSVDLAGYVTNLEKANVKAMALRGGVGVAGVALGALSGRAHEADQGLGILTDTASGAAIGFAIGGPWGAAIGGAGGALVGLTTATDGARDAQGRLKDSAAGVADSLNLITGAATKATRATAAKALADNGAFTAAKRMGIASKDVLDAATGNEAAFRRVKRATDEWATSLIKSGDYTEREEGQLRALLDAINATSNGIDKQRKHILQATAAITGIPENVVTQFKTPGAPGAVRTAVKVAAAYGLSPKEVKTILKALNYTKKDVDAALDQLNRLPKSRTITITTRKITEHLDRFLGSLPGGGGKPKKRADGGPIFGPGGPRDDRVPVLASNGEHMLTAREVKAAGGHDAIYDLRRSLTGQSPRRLATGGPTTGPTSMRGPARPTVTPQVVLPDDFTTKLARELAKTVGPAVYAAIAGGSGRAEVAARQRLHAAIGRS